MFAYEVCVWSYERLCHMCMCMCMLVYTEGDVCLCGVYVYVLACECKHVYALMCRRAHRSGLRFQSHQETKLVGQKIQMKAMQRRQMLDQGPMLSILALCSAPKCTTGTQHRVHSFCMNEKTWHM